MTVVYMYNVTSTSVNKLSGADVGPLKWRVSGCGLNRFIHDDMNDISNVKFHLKTHSANVNIMLYLIYYEGKKSHLNGNEINIILHS